MAPLLCAVTTLREMNRTATLRWHIRDETYVLALKRFVDQEQPRPPGAVWRRICLLIGRYFFRVDEFGLDAARLNAHYGDEPAVTFDTHVSD